MVCVIATGTPGVAILLDGVNVEANTNEGRVEGVNLGANAGLVNLVGAGRWRPFLSDGKPGG